MVDLTHANMQSTVLNNGRTSKWFDISRALKQGCALSPNLFTLVIEILGLKLRKNYTIHRIGPMNKLHDQYADDIWADISFCQESLDDLLDVFEGFSTYSGMKINYAKTQIMKIGLVANETLNSHVPMKWVKEIKVLGVDFQTDKDRMIQINYDRLLARIEL